MSLSKELKIVAKGQKPLSKNQQLFNKLSQRIEALEKEIISESEKLSKLLVLYSKEIVPIDIKLANSRVSLAQILSKATEQNKFGKKQLEYISGTILYLCKEAFQFIEPTPEHEALYDKWSDISYKDELKQEEEEDKEMFSSFMSDMFDIDVDAEDFEYTPEGFAKFKEQLNEKTSQHEHKFSKKNKTKRQLASEETQKATEVLKNKSIRSIYIALTKVLHPDTETDPVLKVEKEEIMKKVTSAYDEKDLSTLLKLEMEWVHKTAEHLELLTEDMLKIYIAALKKQAAELEHEKTGLRHHPRFAPIANYAYMPEKYAFNNINNDKRTLKQHTEELNKISSIFRQPNMKKQIAEFTKDFYLENIEGMDDFDDIFNDFRF